MIFHYDYAQHIDQIWLLNVPPRFKLPTLSYIPVLLKLWHLQRQI